MKEIKEIHFLTGPNYVYSRAGISEQPREFCRKTRKSAHNIYAGIMLISEMQEAIKTEKCLEYFPQILTYLLKMHKVLSKFCKVYFEYNVTEVIQVVSGSEPYATQISAICNFLIAISKFIKVRVHVPLCENGDALDILHQIYGKKFNHRIQNFLLRIDYWVDKMTVREKVKYHLF